MTTHRSPRKVLVLDADSRTALAACRSLGRAGYEVATMTTFGGDLASHSQYVTRHHLRAPDVPLGSTIDELADRHGYDVAVAAKDFTIAELGAAPPMLPTVPFLGPALDRLNDKVGLASIAESAEVPYPATVDLDRDAEAQSLVYPAMVKAARSARVLDDGSIGELGGAVLARDRTEIEHAAARIRRHGLVPIAQNRVERTDKINVTILRRNDECEVRFPYRVLRDVPLTGGIAVSLETLPAREMPGIDAVAALERVCAEARYEGIANGEFCMTPGGGLTLIEVNTRPWGSLWFAEQLGQQVMERAVRLALGEKALPAAQPASHARYHNVAGELRWARLHRRSGRALLGVAADLRPGDVYEYIDRADLSVVAWVALGKARRTWSRRSR